MAAVSSPKTNFFIAFLLVHDLLHVVLTPGLNIYTRLTKNASKNSAQSTKFFTLERGRRRIGGRGLRADLIWLGIPGASGDGLGEREEEEEV
jgi:hypothetical protein